MSKISWGQPKIWFAESTGARPANGSGWTLISTPQDGTTTLNTTAGTEYEAKEEGGATVDKRTDKSVFQLEFTLFKKKNESLPIGDDDGVIATNYAIALQPLDAACDGLRIDFASVTVEKTYSSADGILCKYTFTAMKPNNPSSGSVNTTNQMICIETVSDPTQS